MFKNVSTILFILFIIYLVTNKVKKIVTKKVKVSSESEEDEEALLKIVKKKIPSQLSNNSTKVVTRKLVPKSKTTIKVKPVIVESDDDSPPPSELKTKSSVFDRLGVGDVSSTTPNFDSNNSPTDSRKVTDFFMKSYFKLNNNLFYFDSHLYLNVLESSKPANPLVIRQSNVLLKYRVMFIMDQVFQLKKLVLSQKE